MKSLSSTCFCFSVFLLIIYARSSTSAFRQFILCLQQQRQAIKLCTEKEQQRMLLMLWDIPSKVIITTNGTPNDWKSSSFPVVSEDEHIWSITEVLYNGLQNLYVTQKLKNDWSGIDKDNIPGCSIHIVELVKGLVEAVVANQKLLDVSYLACWLTAFHLFSLHVWHYCHDLHSKWYSI